MNLRQHQVRALADLYVRMQARALHTQDLLLHPPGGHELRKALASQGELWQMPCRSGKTRAALSALYAWQTWLADWGIRDGVRQLWAYPHLVLVPSDLVRDGPWVKDWEAVVPPWDERFATWKPGRPLGRYGLWTIPTLETGIENVLHWLRPGDVAVITYHTLLHRQFHITQRHKWHMVVADEIHRLKNPSADWTQAAYKLKSVFRLGMSATPFTNYVHELREVLAWLQGWTVGKRRESSIWPSSEHWSNAYCKWEFVRTEKGAYRKIPAGALYPDHLYHKLRAEVMFSATREEVSDAPDPIIKPLPIPLSEKQAEVYQQLKTGVLTWAKQGKVDSIDTGPILAQLTYLFQLCADARQLEVSLARKRDSDNIIGITGVEPTFSEGWTLADKNSKLRALLWVLDKVADTSEQVLVLTGFAYLANFLTRDLRRLGYSAEAITGDSPDRAGTVFRFGAGETRVVVCTRAAWEGISLRAPYAVLFGFVDHTPGMVKQALLRAWNMFDDAAVEVYDVYAPGTVEAWNRQGLAKKDQFFGMMTHGQEEATFPSIDDIEKALDGEFTRVN